MPKEQDRRTLIEKIDDMIADDIPLRQIADKLFISYPQVRSRYLALCQEMGVKPDGD
jgi:hypothetical protein